MCASPSAVAPPPMSFFMLSMPASFLMSSPPVSKHTPLPTSVIFGSVTLPQVMSISRGARGEPAPTAATSGKFFSSASPLVTLTLAPCCLASARAASSSSAGPMSFDGVLMRSRASAAPSTMRVRSSPSTPSGTTSRTLRVLRLAVAGELIGAERKGQAPPAAHRAAHWRNDRCRAAAASPSAPGRNRSFTGSSALSRPNKTPASLPSAAGTRRWRPGFGS